MRAIKVYCPPGVEPPLYAFIDALDGKLKAKLLWQIFRLRNLSACELKEPHFKHFSLERYPALLIPVQRTIWILRPMPYRHGRTTGATYGALMEMFLRLPSLSTKNSSIRTV